MINNLKELLAFARTLKRKKVAVIFPNNKETFLAASGARDEGLADFIFVGDEKTIGEGLRSLGLKENDFKIRPAKTIPEAIREAIVAVREGEADILMKGGVETSTMMRAVLDAESGLRIGRILSDIFVFEYPRREPNKFIMITDGGINLAPDLHCKIELIHNAVEVAHALGNLNPKVAVLSATEFVLPNLPSTLDAAALAKMNERGQIRGCVVDGPLALDSAISPEAVEEKGIDSPVAGKAEILIAPNIESANSLAKSTTYFADLPLAHVIVGGKVPILIPSRADKAGAKLNSIALGVVMSEYTQRRM